MRCTSQAAMLAERGLPRLLTSPAKQSRRSERHAYSRAAGVPLLAVIALSRGAYPSLTPRENHGGVSFRKHYGPRDSAGPAKQAAAKLARMEAETDGAEATSKRAGKPHGPRRESRLSSLRTLFRGPVKSGGCVVDQRRTRGPDAADTAFRAAQRAVHAIVFAAKPAQSAISRDGSSGDNKNLRHHKHPTFNTAL